MKLMIRKRKFVLKTGCEFLIPGRSLGTRNACKELQNDEMCITNKRAVYCRKSRAFHQNHNLNCVQWRTDCKKAQSQRAFLQGLVYGICLNFKECETIFAVAHQNGRLYNNMVTIRPCCGCFVRQYLFHSTVSDLLLRSMGFCQCSVISHRKY